MENELGKGDEKPHSYEGHLLKFTNVVKGFQYRWFVVNNASGTLEYFEKQDQKYVMKPRGCISLIGAEVIPLADDSFTFLINSKTGIYFKLKASNTKDRQEWVNNLRKTISYFSKLENRSYCSSSNSSFRFKHDGDSLLQNNSVLTAINDSSQGSGQFSIDYLTEPAIYRSTKEIPEEFSMHHEPFKNVAVLIAQMDELNAAFIKDVEMLPGSGQELTFCDKNLLLTKASSSAAIDSLKKCLTLLRNQKIIYWKFFQNHNRGEKQDGVINNNGVVGNNDTNNIGPSPLSGEIGNDIYKNKRSGTGIDSGSVSSLPATICSEEGSRRNGDHIGVPEPISSAKSNDQLSNLKYNDSLSDSSNLLLPIEGMDRIGCNPIDLTKAVPDKPYQLYFNDENSSEGGNNDTESHKSVIQHLISQIKLGMDLTKVTLPTFILEKRSLLEMFSDFMAHPDLFMRINEESSPERRMRAVVIWYLTAFHAGKKSSVAKKPYNPIIGETFHCMWHVKDNYSDSYHQVRYTAEQVSHHPPITAFHVNNSKHSMRLSGSIHTRSKFQGMSVTAQMIGKLTLTLGEPFADEIYLFNLPNAHAKNILSVPKLELGDKVVITCPATKYSASIVFHNKPMFGNSAAVNKISGEIKDPDNKIFIKITGDWSSIIELQDILTEETFSQKVNDLPLCDKYVNPLDEQRNHESRKLWFNVTEALRNHDLDKATKYKTELEIRQRQSEKARLSKKLPFPVKYFIDNSENKWLFKNDIKYLT